MEDPTDPGRHLIRLSPRIAVEILELVALDVEIVLLVVDGERFVELDVAGEA